MRCPSVSLHELYTHQYIVTVIIAEERRRCRRNYRVLSVGVALLATGCLVFAPFHVRTILSLIISSCCDDCCCRYIRHARDLLEGVCWPHGSEEVYFVLYYREWEEGRKLFYEIVNCRPTCDLRCARMRGGKERTRHCVSNIVTRVPYVD